MARFGTRWLPSLSAGLLSLCAIAACGSESDQGGDGNLAGDGDMISAGDGDMTGDGDTASGGSTGDGDADGSGGTANEEAGFTLTRQGNLYTYTLGESSMTIDAEDGARVVNFVVEGVETLVQAGTGPGQYGSVFWPSPQSDWTWPPPAEIDSGTYVATVSENQLSLASETNATLGLAVTSTFEPTTTASGIPAISVTYEIHNNGTSPRDVAAWEVSRVASGMAFYPTGPSGQLFGHGELPDLDLTEIGAHSWYTHSGTSSEKSYADGADGWLAWTTGSAIVVKSFDDIGAASFAASEAEIEIYAGGNYFEVEQQGPVQSIPAGDSSIWTVVWFGISVPPGTETSEGSTALTSLVTEAL